MGEAAEVTGTGDGGSAARDGGARCTREVRGRSRAARSAAQHTAARRRVRTGRASTVTSPLSGITYIILHYFFSVVSHLAERIYAFLTISRHLLLFVHCLVQSTRGFP